MPRRGRWVVAATAVAVLGFGFFHAKQTGLLHRAWFIHRARALRESTSIRVSVGSPDAARPASTITDAATIREIVADLTAGGQSACSPGRSACPFWLKLTFVAEARETEVFLAVDDCRQFYLDDGEWQGTFADPEGTALHRLTTEARAAIPR